MGYELVFVDVDSETWTMDPGSLERALGACRADVVVSVDALGNPAPYRELSAICRDAGVPLIADSAPSIGARYGGQPVGNQVPVHAFSLSFAKLVSAGCDGGALVLPLGTDLEAGGNWVRSSLMSELSAVVALDQLGHFEQLLDRRRSIAAVYTSLCGRLDGLLPQCTRLGDSPSLVHWAARVLPPRDRDVIQRQLLLDGVQSKPYYSPGLHELLPGRLAPGGLPVTEELTREVIALPMSSEMTVEDARLVAACVAAAFLGAS